MNDADRFFARVRPTSSGCLIWVGCIRSDGYGSFRAGGRSILAHRWLFERIGIFDHALHLVLDHLCRNRACVRPSHLEPVTRAENTRRSPLVGQHWRDKTRCPYGHPYDKENTLYYRGRRHCRTYKRTGGYSTYEWRAAYMRGYRRQRRLAKLGSTIYHQTIASLSESGLAVTIGPPQIVGAHGRSQFVQAIGPA